MSQRQRGRGLELERERGELLVQYSLGFLSVHVAIKYWTKAYATASRQVWTGLHRSTQVWSGLNRPVQL